MAVLRRYVGVIAGIAAVLIVWLQLPEDWPISAPEGDLNTYVTWAFWILFLVTVVILFWDRNNPDATTVEIDNRVSREYTVLDVYTGDRVGLLFTITNCLYHLWLEIHLAKINTMVDQVLDVFYVTDNEGRKIEDAHRLEMIRGELVRALETEAAAAAPSPARAAGG